MKKRNEIKNQTSSTDLKIDTPPKRVTPAEVKAGFLKKALFPVTQDKIPAVKKGWTWKHTERDKKPILRGTDSLLCGLDLGQLGLVVVDFDTQKPDFSEEAEILRKFLAQQTDFRFKTPGGGDHFWFIGKAFNSRPWPGCDIQGNNGAIYLYYNPAKGFNTQEDFLRALPEWRDSWIRKAEGGELKSDPKNREFGPGKNNRAIPQRAGKAGKLACLKTAKKDLFDMIQKNPNNPELEKHIDDYMGFFLKSYRGKLPDDLLMDGLKEQSKKLSKKLPADYLKAEALLQDEPQNKKIKYIPTKTKAIEPEIRARLKALKIDLRYNIRDQIEEYKREDGKWENLTDGEDSKLYSDCHQKIETLEKNEPIKITIQDWHKHIKAIIHRAEVDPFKEYLKDLPKWDKETRLKNVLSELFLISGNKELAEWSFKTVLLAAVKRTFEPASKFDHMIILQGPEGIGKSSLWSCLLEKQNWFTDNMQFSDRNKETIEATIGSVIVENPELAGARKGELEKIKALITRQTDKVRLAYRRKTSLLPRRFVLVGTTNNPEGLPNDPGGNRRFIPISLDKLEKTAYENGKKVIEYIKKNRQQLWAEALDLYQNKKASLTIPDSLQETARLAAEKQRSRNELLEEAVLEKINGILKITMQDIATFLIEKKIFPAGGVKKGAQREIAAFLRKQGFKKRKTTGRMIWFKDK